MAESAWATFVKSRPKKTRARKRCRTCGALMSWNEPCRACIEGRTYQDRPQPYHSADVTCPTCGEQATELQWFRSSTSHSSTSLMVLHNDDVGAGVVRVMACKCFA